MIAWAAVDVRGGRVVQLVGGRPDEERVSMDDPTAVARAWLRAGFAGLHVVDLDAALGTGSNAAAVEAIIAAAAGHPVQAGGGVRSTERAAVLLDAGAARVVVGTRAIEDPDWRTDLAQRWPGRVLVAADVRDGEVVVRGWTRGAGRTIHDVLRELAGQPLAGVLVTDVTREGSMQGVDVDLFETLVGSTDLPVLASGGVADAEDLAALARIGVAGAVLGMALYTGALDAVAVAREYAV
jgi:phosphoribosylformimino-5-aminoimidazole carboxamide ribotide isomerase